MLEASIVNITSFIISLLHDQMRPTRLEFPKEPIISRCSIAVSVTSKTNVAYEFAGAVSINYAVM